MDMNKPLSQINDRKIDKSMIELRTRMNKINRRRPPTRWTDDVKRTVSQKVEQAFIEHWMTMG